MSARFVPSVAPLVEGDALARHELDHEMTKRRLHDLELPDLR